MQYTSTYASPIGSILLASDDIGLIGSWFEDQKYFAVPLDKNHKNGSTDAIELAKNWLDVYFSGQEPDFEIPLHLMGTAFQLDVWEILRTIPYGRTLTYGDIAAQIAAKRGLPHMSAQAVGGAVGRNPVSIIVPCHRVIGGNGGLTGYAGGLDRKSALLALEKNQKIFLQKL